MASVPDPLPGTGLEKPTTVRLRPSFEGNNISHAMGFKHINYLAEAAVLEHFRAAGLPAGLLYRRYGLGFDVIELSSRLGALLDVDDEVVAEVAPRPATPGSPEMEEHAVLQVLAS